MTAGLRAGQPILHLQDHNMKLANTIFAIGIGVYYVLGVYTSILWADYYYGIVFGYICSLISNSKMIRKDKIFAYIVSLTIWTFYLTKQLIGDIDICNWIRWGLGIIFVLYAVYYYFKPESK